MKFLENRSLVKEFVECGRTDRQIDKQTESNSGLSLFCW